MKSIQLIVVPACALAFIINTVWWKRAWTKAMGRDDLATGIECNLVATANYLSIVVVCLFVTIFTHTRH